MSRAAIEFDRLFVAETEAGRLELTLVVEKLPKRPETHIRGILVCGQEITHTEAVVASGDVLAMLKAIEVTSVLPGAIADALTELGFDPVACDVVRLSEE